MSYSPEISSSLPPTEVSIQRGEHAGKFLYQLISRVSEDSQINSDNVVEMFEQFKISNSGENIDFGLDYVLSLASAVNSLKESYIEIDTFVEDRDIDLVVAMSLLMDAIDSNEDYR